MWGAWSEGVLYGKQKGAGPKKQSFFGKNFVLNNYGIFLEKRKTIGKKRIRKRISN